MKLVLFLRGGQGRDLQVETDMARDSLKALGEQIAQQAVLFNVGCIALDIRRDSIEMRTFAGTPGFDDASNPAFTLRTAVDNGDGR